MLQVLQGQQELLERLHQEPEQQRLHQQQEQLQLKQCEFIIMY